LSGPAPVHFNLHGFEVKLESSWTPVDHAANSRTVGLTEGGQFEKCPKAISRHKTKVGNAFRDYYLAGMRMLWKNIKGLVGAYDVPPSRLHGKEMRDFPVIENAWLAIDSGQIIDFGSMDTFPGIADWNGLEVLDCTGRFVLPAWCDSHTHLVYATDRSEEFLSRVQGKSYQEIAEEGGGILNSAKALQAMSEEALYEDAHARLERAIAQGTGAIEIKSGYGLSAESEMKMLRVIQRLANTSPIPIRRTFLACHAIPKGDWDAQRWTQHMVQDVLPSVIQEGLADYVDAFCEEGYFGLDEVEFLLKSTQSAGLPAKIHVNQFNAFGAVPLCAKYNAVSVDHLEELNAEDVEALQASNASGNAGTMATALPGCSYFLGIPYTPARRLMDVNVPLAIATDFNPGSAPSSNMARIVQLAILKMNMLPIEAIAAATLNGAAAMGVSDRAGAVARGRQANLLLTRPLPGLQAFGYDFGVEPVEKVFIDGMER